LIKKTIAKTGRTQQRKLPELPVTDIDEEDGEGRSFVFYGRSGTGKTTVAASFPKPMLYLDVTDRGAKSIRDVKGIKKLKISEFEELEDAYWWLKENPDRYKTIVVDTLSQLQRIVVQDIGAKKSKGGGRKAGDWGTLTKRDWGDIAALLKEWITNYRDLVDLGMDVVFIAQDRTFNMPDEDEDVDEQLAPEVGPGLSPAVAKALNAAVDMIGNTFIRTSLVKVTVPGKKVSNKTKEVVEYCMRVGPNSLYVTKVRKPKSIEAPAVIVDPEYEDIMAIIEGEE